MAITKPEWFKMDPAKFLSDGQVDAMTTVELGACFRLICRQWLDGFIPDDLRMLARLCRLDDTAMGEAWQTLSNFFPVVEVGKRANRFMWIEREKVVADLEKRSDEGTKAARKRWEDVKNKRDAKPNGSGIGTPMQDQTRPEQTTADQSREEKPSPEQTRSCEVNVLENPKKATKHKAFKELIFRCYEHLNPEEKTPWDGSDANQLSAVIKAVPTLDAEKFYQWLKNYIASENINPAARPRAFLPKITDYASGPLDKFGRPIETHSALNGSAVANARTLSGGVQ
jgi:uncharacterized protein YdaU (DUF1376 family)